MLERDLERRFCHEVEKMGGMPLKFVSPNCRGVPDRLVLLPMGVMAFAEIKRPGGKLRSLQSYRKAQIEKLGFRVWVIDSEKQIEAFCSEYHPPS